MIRILSARRLQADVFGRREYCSYDAERVFASIDELREEQGADGTHSILDMQRVVSTAAPPCADVAQAAQRLLAAVFSGGDDSYGIVYRLSETEALERFGVERLIAEPDPAKLDIERGTVATPSFTRTTNRSRFGSAVCPATDGALEGFGGRGVRVPQSGAGFFDDTC